MTVCLNSECLESKNPKRNMITSPQIVCIDCVYIEIDLEI